MAVLHMRTHKRRERQGGGKHGNVLVQALSFLGMRPAGLPSCSACSVGDGACRQSSIADICL